MSQFKWADKIKFYKMQKNSNRKRTKRIKIREYERATFAYRWSSYAFSFCHSFAFPSHIVSERVGMEKFEELQNKLAVMTLALTVEIVFQIQCGRHGCVVSSCKR